MSPPTAIAIAAHPDDIEFMMAGTLLLLRAAGYQIHYLNLSSGHGGSRIHSAATVRRTRRREAKKAAALLGAQYHESYTDDLEIVYSVRLLRALTAVMRTVKPSIVLTHSPQDYMEDHATTSRLTVTAAFARGIPNFSTQPRTAAWLGETTVYHALPHGLCDGLRRRVVAGAYVNTTSVQAKKLAALACHESQQSWLQASQGMNSYLHNMTATARAVGKQSGKFRWAEGWRRHSHLGFCTAEADPLRTALGKKYLVNRTYERGLAIG
jgi:hypothetical protein